MSPTIHPSGFRISDRPVAASFAHPYSFQPLTDPLLRDDACLVATMGLGGTSDGWVRYWDESSTVAVLEFKPEEPVQVAQPVKEKKEKKKKSWFYCLYCKAVSSDYCLVEADTTIARSAPAAPSILPVSGKPVTLAFSKGPIKATISRCIFHPPSIKNESDLCSKTCFTWVFIGRCCWRR